jgi:hypothetical protein
VQLVPPNENYRRLITYLDMGSALSPLAKDAGFFTFGPMSRTSCAVPANGSGCRAFAIISCLTFSWEGL